MKATTITLLLIALLAGCDSGGNLVGDELNIPNDPLTIEQDGQVLAISAWHLVPLIPAEKLPRRLILHGCGIAPWDNLSVDGSVTAVLDSSRMLYTMRFDKAQYDWRGWGRTAYRCGFSTPVVDGTVSWLDADRPELSYVECILDVGCAFVVTPGDRIKLGRI